MSAEPKPPRSREPSGGLPGAMRWLCGFAVVFAGFLFATKPATNEAQMIFRIVLFVGGLTGLLVLWLRGRRQT